MKIRTDFVTNSSSSSFILAQKGELTDKQKEAVVKAVENSLMGTVVLDSNASEKEIQNFFEDYYVRNKKDQEKIRDALKSGKNICCGAVDFEDADWTIQDIFSNVWDALESDPNVFEVIDGDLDY